VHRSFRQSSACDGARSQARTYAVSGFRLVIKKGHHASVMFGGTELYIQPDHRLLWTVLF
jgi:hypothetical protein